MPIYLGETVVATFESRYAGAWLPSTRHFLAGSTGGVPAGLVLSTVLEPWVLGFLLGLLFGLLYVVAVSPSVGSALDHLLTGATLAIPAWIVVQVTILALVTSGSPAWTPASMAGGFSTLPPWVVAGLLVGLLVPIASSVLDIDDSPAHPDAGLGASISGPGLEAQATTDVTNIVIVGGGFAGVTAAKQLERRFGPDPSVSITLVSDRNAVLFTPMLAEVAAGSIEPTHITSPLRTSLRRTRIVQAEFTGLDPDDQRIHLGDGPGNRQLAPHNNQPMAGEPTLESEQDAGSKTDTLPYDHLILSLGSVSDRKGVGETADFVFDFKTLRDAAALRNHVVACFEQANREADPAVRETLLTFVIAGGGFAGAELAGALNDFVRGLLVQYPALSSTDVRVVLVHSRDRIMPELSESLAQYALEQMQARGVAFELGSRVETAEANVVTLSTGETIRTGTLVWTAGTRPNPVIESLELPQTEFGAVRVDKSLAVSNCDGIWAVGDCTAVTDETTGGSAPGTAAYAIRAATVLGDNVHASVTGGNRTEITYRSPGSLAVIGHQTACAEIRGRQFSGLFAWLLWRTVYLSKLPGIDRKIRVAVDWIVELFFPRELVQTLALDESVQDSSPGPIRSETRGDREETHDDT